MSEARNQKFFRAGGGGDGRRGIRADKHFVRNKRKMDPS